MPNLVHKTGHSMADASVVMCFGLAITYLLLPDEDAIAIYRTAAIGTALAIGLGIFLEARGLRSLVRTDFVTLMSLFGLTLVEFFFPQEEVQKMVTAQSATHGVEALFLGFAGLIIGRNFAPKTPAAANAGIIQWRPATLFSTYVLFLFLGYLPMLIAVGFDPVELVQQMLGPRFSQPWVRGRFGGLSDAAGTLGELLLYVVPAIGGAILASSSTFTILQRAVVILGLALTFFYGFSSGTRNVFCIYLLIFVASYVLLKHDITWRRIIVLLCVAVALLYAGAYYMLQFRDIGLKSYVEAGGQASGFRKETLFIDNNLPVISLLIDVFPKRFNYLGSEYLSWAILHPVPRALWPGKPQDLSVSAEKALGWNGLTVTSTFVGEAYMMGGFPAILVVGLSLGWLAGWWNRFCADLRSNVGVILYASGFFTAALSMRSIVFTTTAMLYTAAIWLYARWHRSKLQPRRFEPAGRQSRN
jgi:hypothetical protein